MPLQSSMAFGRWATPTKRWPCTPSLGRFPNAAVERKVPSADLRTVPLSDFPAKKRRLRRCAQRPTPKPPFRPVVLSASLFRGRQGARCGCAARRQSTRCGLFDEMGAGLRLRHAHRVTAFYLDDRGAGALRHHPLGVRRDHFVFGSDHVPAWLCSPRGLGDRAIQRVQTPRDLGVRHERGRVWTHVPSECSWEFRLIEEQVRGCPDRS